MTDSYDSTDDQRIGVSVDGDKSNIMRHQYRTLNDADKSNMKEAKDRGLQIWNMLDDESFGGPDDQNTLEQEGLRFQAFVDGLAGGHPLSEELMIAKRRIDTATGKSGIYRDDRKIAIREAVMWAVQHVTR